jgi:hypothetical protein
MAVVDDYLLPSLIGLVAAGKHFEWLFQRKTFWRWEPTEKPKILIHGRLDT